MMTENNDKVRAKKHLGQHFLTDKQLAQKIVRTLTAKPDDQVVEIGPGMGILSQYLFPQFANFKLIEIDGESIDYLKTHFAQYDPQIIHSDVLQWNVPQSLSPDAYLIGNLPYNISSPIFFQMLEHRSYFQQGVFMIQKEVAERIAAKHGSKIFGILSVLIQHFYEVKYEFSVPPTVFSPPPKVMSAVISMRRRQLDKPADWSKLKHLVKTAFNQRRKTLRNALKSIAFTNPNKVAHWMDKRAEQLSVDEFVQMSWEME